MSSTTFFELIALREIDGVHVSLNHWWLKIFQNSERVYMCHFAIDWETNAIACDMPPHLIFVILSHLFGLETIWDIWNLYLYRHMYTCIIHMDKYDHISCIYSIHISHDVYILSFVTYLYPKATTATIFPWLVRLTVLDFSHSLHVGGGVLMTICRDVCLFSPHCCHCHCIIDCNLEEKFNDDL